jgi:hypothetical protein
MSTQTAAMPPPPEPPSPANRRIANASAHRQADPRMAARSQIRTLVNPRPEAVRLILSDGSERVVAPWGMTVLPRSASDGHSVDVVTALLLERRSIPGAVESEPESSVAPQGQPDLPAA